MLSQILKKMKKISVVMLLIGVINSCGETTTELNNNSLKMSNRKYLEIQTAVPNKDSLLGIKPIEFLKFLAHGKLEKSTETNKIINIIPLNFFIYNEWVTIDDVRELMTLIYNQEISSTPWPIISSQMPMVHSTVGIEAMHLINIYKDTTFHYPSLCSTHYLCKPEEQMEKAKEMEIWWKAEQNRSSH